MNPLVPPLTRIFSASAVKAFFLFLLAIFSFSPAASAQTVWASAAAGDWNTAGSWSPAIVPGVGTNASIIVAGTFTVTYTAPMSAANIASLTLGSGSSIPTLTITAAGFNDAGTCTLVDSGAEAININSGGVMTNNALTMTSQDAVVTVNTGGILTNKTTQVANNSSSDGNSLLKINSGAVASLGAVTVGRHSESSTRGLSIGGGTVSAVSIDVGTRNSYATMSVSGGTLTNAGSLRLGTGTPTAGREMRYSQTGGTVGCAGTMDMSVAASATTWFTVSGSSTTFSADGIRIFPNAVSSLKAGFTNSGNIYLGASGFKVLNSGTYTVLLNDQSVLGATADWAANVNLTTASGNITFKCADQSGNAHNITLTNPITGGAGLTKSGGGTLTLLGANTYSGSTTNSAGLFLLGNASALPKGTALTVGGSGTTGIVDLAGFNIQVSGLNTAGTAANQTITNSSAANTSTLTFSNSAANSVFGGSVAGNKPIALTILGGNLTLSGQNNNYGGNLFISNGKLALSGAGSTFTGSTIVLSNAAAALDISGIGGISLGAGQNLSGYGVITGNVTAANCPVSPGANGTAGTLSFSNSLTLNGGVTNHFDLALDPALAGNDLIVVAGALNVGGTNMIEVAPIGASLSAGTYKLIKFGSLGSGGVTNFQLTGTLGASLQAIISVSATEVDLIVSALGGTQRIWAGDGSTNNWDYTTTNWLNSGSLDVFSDGNFVTFDDTGSIAPPVNLTATLQPAAVLVNAVANYVFSGSGKISGSGTLTKTNSGALIILTTNNYSGVTTINQGVLQLGNGAISGTLGTNVIQNSGSLVLNLPGSNNFPNVISGTGKLVQASSGTLALTASNSYSGGTTISNGTLQLNTGAWFGNGNVTNNGVLAFNHIGSLTVGTIISGTGAVNLRGGGTLTLTGNNSYGGGTTVSNSSTLLVNNSTGSGTGGGAVIVASGSTLSGNGIIGGAVTINSGGIFAPGNSVGTLTVSNNFTASSGAILNYTLGTSSDKTIVSSNLNLSGTLNITAGSGFTSTTYTLFTYGGALALGTLNITLPANTTSAINTNTPGLVNLVVATVQTNIPAFPGALGFGAAAYGGRIGGTIYHVTNTNDSGAGSFRTGVGSGNRIIVFDVGGYINLLTAVSCSSGLTIAGQTAPGGGIGIMGAEVSFYGQNNIICRHVRFRQGDIHNASNSGNAGESAINLGASSSTSPSSTMIFDHCSVGFGSWDSIDAVNTVNFTIQYCIIADPINQRFGAHVEGGNACYVNNLWVNGHNRQPLAKANTVYVNNVIYNYQAGYTCGDTGGFFSHDIINNYFITGPSTSSASDDFYQIDANQSTYGVGNLRDSDDNGALGGSTTDPNEGGPILTSPWSAITATIPTSSTLAAYRINVSSSGTFPSDQVDQQIIGNVTSLGSAGRMFNSQTDTGLGNDGYGVITNGILPVDTDGDGMPDYWEQALGSNPNVADGFTAGTGGYTKIENYLNWLATPHAIASKNSFVDVDLRQYTGGFTNASPVYAVLLPTNGTVALLPDGHTAEFTATGNFSGLGSFNFSVLGNDGTAMTNTVGVLVTATGQSQNLTWRGDGAINNWDTTSTNWLNGINLVSFGAGDTVTFDDTGSNTPAINLTGALTPASVTVGANQNYTLGGSGSLGGSMSLAKSSAGILTMSASNTFSGGTFVQGGTIVMGNASANSYGLGTGALTLSDGTKLTLFDAGPSTDAGTLPNNLVVSGNTILELPERGGAGGATLTGSGTFNLITHYVRGNFNYDSSGFTGTFNALTPDSSADFRIGSYAGFANATVNLSNNINAYFTSTINPSGNTVDFGQINAPASATLQGGPTGGRAVAIRIGALNTDSSFAGSIVEQNTNSTTSLIKIGSGTLTLGGANSYSGQTIVSNGTIVINGSTGTNSFVVVNGMLGGNGAIGGGASIYSGNVIAPGANVNPGTVGTLTITNGLALTNATLYFDLASATNSGGGVNDLISLSGGTLVLSGTTTVAPNLLNGFLTPGVYTLISGGSATIGSAANLAWAGAVGSRQTFTFDTTTIPGSVLLDVAGLPPATLVWQGTNGSAWDVNNTINWLNAGSPDKYFDLDSVIFDDTSTNGNVIISGIVQPGQVTVTNSILNYNINGGVLGGAGSLVKNGSGILTLGGSNSFSGGTFINGGTIYLSNDVANQFGLGTGAVTLNGGTLSMYDNVNTFNSAAWNLIVPTNSNGTLNTDSRCDLYGSLAGGGTLNFNVTYVRTSLFGDWSAFTGNINVTGGGEFRVLNFTGYPNAAINLANNNWLDFQGAVDPAGTTLQIGALSGAGSSTLYGGAAAGNIFTWQIGGANVDATFAGTIAEQNTNAITAIEKIGSGTWTLTGSNSFVGGMTVSDGTLQVNNTNGSATGTNQVFVADGATLSGSGSIGGLTAFDDGAILAPGNPSGTLTISNELDLSDLTELQFGLGTNSDEVAVSGNLVFGGQLNITNTGGFGAGTYTLFTYGGTLTLGNPAIASAPAGFVYSISTNIAGQISLVVQLPTPPTIGGITLTGGNLALSGSGGPVNGTFYLLNATNVALPLNLWMRIATNQFDSSGNFIFTNAINTNSPQSFYLLQLP